MSRDALFLFRLAFFAESTLGWVMLDGPASGIGSSMLPDDLFD
jgi:hypothetical protein